MQDKLEARVKELYRSSKSWQESRGIEFRLTYEEYFGLFSRYRLNKIATLSDKAWRAYRYGDQNNKPVCSWTSKEEKQTGVMHVGNARIMRAIEAKMMFAIKKGEKHRPESIEKMKKPKTEAARKNMSEGAKKRWAKYREEKGNSNV